MVSATREGPIMDERDISLAMENKLQERIENERNYYEEDPEDVFNETEYDPWEEAQALYDATRVE